MDAEDNWLKIAKSLPAGYKVRVRCCRKDNSMLVSYDTKCYRAYCFRCGRKEWKPVGMRTLAQIMLDRRNLEAIKKNGVSMPQDFVNVVPAPHNLWYLTKGLTGEDMQQNGVGWSEQAQRIVLPVRLDGHLMALQLRAVHGDQKPKYLNPEGPSVAKAVFYPCGMEYSTETAFVVVVEDILSAIKLDKAGIPAVSVLGTNPTDARLNRILQTSKTVLWWFDNDTAGRRGSQQGKFLTELSGGIGIEIYTNEDPKCYDLQTIKDTVKGHLRDGISN